MRTAALAACSLVVAMVAPGTTRGAEGRDPGDLFTGKVRPILSRHCFKCHGPDEKSRKARLRLDVRDAALRPASSGFRPIVPGDPDESELVARVFSEDEEEVMPPPQAKIPLSDEDKEVLKLWIARGAEYKEHWAFVPPRKARPPEVEREDWPRGAIDAFVLARLEAVGLAPSPEADRRTLIRRVSLDLIGLPPTPDEVDAFVADLAPDAYERLVDRLLASPHYGERWARPWLDLARYADTNGYEKDRARSIWPYRDWVIRALNADMPFDRFTVEQLAGDMLPGATTEQKVATGFHRNTMLNEEGGIDPLEFRFHATTDRVATTATVWLGLTLGCAQCHTHKFDPIPHRDYYRFMALLNNADEPEIPVPSEEIGRRRRAIEEQLAAKVDGLADRFPAEGDEGREATLSRKFRAWLDREAAGAVAWTPLRPVRADAGLPRLSVLEDGSVLASGDQSKSDAYTLEFDTELRGITAIRLDVLPDARLPRGGPGRVYYEGPIGDFFLSEFSVTAGGEKVPISGAAGSYSRPKFTAELAIDGDQQTGWSIDGGQGKEHSAVFRLGATPGDSGRFAVRLLFERYYAAGLGRFRISATTDPRPIAAPSLPAELESLVLVPEGERTEEQRGRLLRRFLEVAPELAEERKAIERLRQELPAYPATLVMEERPSDDPRPTFLHHRGEYLQPTERVEPGVLSILPPLPRDGPADRLALARWLVSPANPLVGRVTMNRYWAAFFGRGLVGTLQDFGYQGETPSHPELLDWLAVEFVEQGWSPKEMHRQIVLSATYRQSSRVTPELRERDAENRLLARGPRVRLEAETIRDQALRIADLLSERVGGPSVFPPQPAGVTTEGAYGRLDWKVSPGEDRFRRGLYTYTKRTAPYAMFATFDAPSGEVCVARREVSNTPLQALTLLNDPVFRDVTQALGRTMASAGGTVEERADALFRRCLARPPTREERASLVAFHEAQRRRCERKELDAGAIAGPGEGDAAERAAWTALARALLNLDEMITKG